jgi:rare lipoprotein A
LLAAVGCAHAPPAATRAAGEAIGEGDASYYGAALRGRLTASGERFDPAELTAAHRTLPFGTCLRVTNLENRRSVEVRVNDRGPFVKGRIVDLSEAAARRLEFVREGVARVRLFLCGI